MLLGGVGLASSIGLFLQMLVIVGLNWNDLFGKKSVEGVKFFSLDTFHGIGLNFKESATSCYLNLGALWAFEFCVFIASYVSPVDTFSVSVAFSAQIILLQFCLIFFALPFGFGTVAYDFITDSVNAGEAIEAKITG